MSTPQVPLPSVEPGTARGRELEQERGHDRESLGELISEATSDLQKLFRQEVSLAKAELREEGAKAGKAAAMLGAAALAGLMVIVLASFALVYALANVMDAGWAALIVAALWAVAGAVLFVLGRNRMREVDPKPEQTIETLKEDAQWARHPTR
ncbi:phage holin family protein [Actinorugispora endophytica]|uniref:Putative superfamily III holin-X n=1 Tax=Actinorugispora endophytica TaxID=1605990 RepID=A0A4R6V959_9ACTN|nr:phage holin family protein [Actinorugispora endophytica]TDQ52968.1 putative superfamily III holin-X [Actinorugispora endophytica]